jgi:hypothetical protein
LKGIKMATPFSATPLSGADLVTITLAADLANGKIGNARLGQQVFGSDGKLYVYAQANGSIPASTAVCTVSPSTFLATSTGGSYTSPATAMSSGDRAWFGKASV